MVWSGREFLVCVRFMVLFQFTYLPCNSTLGTLFFRLLIHKIILLIFWSLKLCSYAAIISKSFKLKHFLLFKLLRFGTKNRWIECGLLNSNNGHIHHFANPAVSRGKKNFSAVCQFFSRLTFFFFFFLFFKPFWKSHPN